MTRLRALLDKARSLLHEAGITSFMAEDPGPPPPGCEEGKPRKEKHARGR